MYHVLIVGGTGSVGKALTKLLLNNLYRVFLLVKNEPKSIEKAQELKDLGADIVYGNLLDSESLANKTRGIDFLFNIAATLGEEFSPGYEALLKDANLYTVQQVIYLSNRPRIVPLFPMFRGKVAVENIHKNSGIPYTIVHAEPFLRTALDLIRPEVDAGQPLGICAKNEDLATKGKHFWISDENVAQALFAMTGLEHAYNKSYNIGGTESLTFLELAQRYGKLVGKPVTEHYVHTTCPPWFAPVPQVYDILSQLAEYESSDLEPLHDLRQFYVNPSNLDDVLIKASNQ